MGQQQLILLVLATVIVGLATVVGIRAFNENTDKSNVDAMMQDAVRIASDAQAALQKPTSFGGVASFNDVTLGGLGYPTASGTYSNVNGDFSITTADAGVVITGTGGENDENQVVVAVCGMSDADVTGAITKIGAQDGDTAPSC